MKLFTKGIEAKLVKNYAATEAAEGGGLHHKPVVKLFDPYGASTWLLSEYNPDEDIAFGLCDLGMGSPELGYVGMKEMKSLRAFGIPRIERDMHWDADGHSLNEYADKAKSEGQIVSYI
jgi:hypothetical protein